MKSISDHVLAESKRVETVSHVGQIDQVDQIDNLDPNLPLWDVVQDLYGTDPTQETCARLYGFPPAT